MDAISEYVLRDQAVLDEMSRIGLEDRDMINADEALWFDQVRCWAVRCETIEEDLGPHQR